MKSRLSQIWQYRSFIFGAVYREFAVRYSNSLLGASWAFLQPLALILVYTLVFSQVMRTKLPGLGDSFAYSIYLCAGVLTWGFFSETITRLINLFIDNALWLKKLRFPRQCLVIIAVLCTGTNFVIIFSLFIIFLIFSNHFPGWIFFQIIALLGIQLLFSIGLGVSLAILNVFFRDVGQLFSIVLQFWFWLTPIVYPISILPPYAQELVRLNPMTNLILAYQDIFVYGRAPHWPELIPLLVISLALCVLASSLFRKHAGDILDEL
jgi:lipopolysaccharide transport system permease protein